MACSAVIDLFFFHETSCVARENSDILDESPIGDLRNRTLCGRVFATDARPWYKGVDPL